MEFCELAFLKQFQQQIHHVLNQRTLQQAQIQFGSQQA